MGSRYPPSPNCCPRSTGFTVCLQMECLSAITGIRSIARRSRWTGMVCRLRLGTAPIEQTGRPTIKMPTGPTNPPFTAMMSGGVFR